MNFHILGLFPNILDNYFSQSLIGQARAKGLIAFYYHQLRDFAHNKHRVVDDRPYGGGSGMVFMPEVVVPAVRELKKAHAIDEVVLMTPAGSLFTPQKARELSCKKNILFLCGRYEGVDQRVIDLVVDQEISIGDYVISGGELACGVVIDAITRYIPGVVGKDESVNLDSHEDGLLEHPHFTRPESFENIPVPPVLLSGNHGDIAQWRRFESLRLTWQRRPDLLKKAELSAEELEFIKGLIHV